MKETTVRTNKRTSTQANTCTSDASFTAGKRPQAAVGAQWRRSGHLDRGLLLAQLSGRLRVVRLAAGVCALEVLSVLRVLIHCRIATLHWRLHHAAERRCSCRACEDGRCGEQAKKHGKRARADTHVFSSSSCPPAQSSCPRGHRSCQQNRRSPLWHRGRTGDLAGDARSADGEAGTGREVRHRNSTGRPTTAQSDYSAPTPSSSSVSPQTVSMVSWVE